jgi:hypothetical protein
MLGSPITCDADLQCGGECRLALDIDIDIDILFMLHESTINRI